MAAREQLLLSGRRHLLSLSLVLSPCSAGSCGSDDEYFGRNTSPVVRRWQLHGARRRVESPGWPSVGEATTKGKFTLTGLLCPFDTLLPVTIDFDISGLPPLSLILCVSLSISLSLSLSSSLHLFLSLSLYFACISPSCLSHRSIFRKGPILIASQCICCCVFDV